MKSPKFSYAIRIVAGAYLIYLAYQLIQNYLNPQGENGVSPAFSIIAAVAFVIIGAIFMISAIRGLYLYQAPQDEEEAEAEEEDSEEDDDEFAALVKDKNAGKLPDKAESAQETAEEEVPAGPETLGSRISKGAAYVNPVVEDEAVEDAEAAEEPGTAEVSEKTEIAEEAEVSEEAEAAEEKK